MSDGDFPVHLELVDLQDVVSLHYALTMLITMDEAYCHMLIEQFGAGVDAAFDAHRRDETSEFHQFARVHQCAPALRGMLEQLNEKNVL